VLLLLVAIASVAFGFGDRGSAEHSTDGALTPKSQNGIAGWTEVRSYRENSTHANEGVATVSSPGHSPFELYRGSGSVPSELEAQGWNHVGDPDSIDGYTFDAYQGQRSSKMFHVTTPSGKTYEYRHTLVPEEIYNNSFVAISPNGQWMVAGEWGEMNHLQIYPTPLLNHETSSDGGSLRLVGFIQLDHQVSNIQGCDFVDQTTLICASEDSPTLFRNEMPLVEIDLPASLSGTTVKGDVIDLGSIPQKSPCSGLFEPEGVDFDVYTSILRVEMVPPDSCGRKTIIYEYKSAGALT
jgi:hypothetical protein